MEKIDVHAHILPEKLPSFREKFGYSGWIRLEHQFDSNGLICSKLVYDDDKTAMRIVDKRLYCIQTRLNEMKKNGNTQNINVGLKNINPYHSRQKNSNGKCPLRGDIGVVISTVPVTFNYWAKSEDNEFVARYLNDNIGNVIRKWPDKFIGLGTVPMQNIELAIKELIRCRTELGMNGLIIGTHVNDQSYDDPIFEPFWKASVDYNMPLFIHPWDVIKPNRWNKFWLPYIVGMTAETTATALQLAFSGVFERHPKLKIILAHCGGTLPYISQRANHAYNVYPEDMCKDFQSPNQYLKQNPNICADTLVHDPNALELAINFFGSNSLLLGSDYPFKLGEDEPGSLIDKLSDRFPMDLKQKIFNKNAKRIFNID